MTSTSSSKSTRRNSGRRSTGNGSLRGEVHHQFNLVLRKGLYAPPPDCEPEPDLSLRPSSPSTPQVPGPIPPSREVTIPIQNVPSSVANSVSNSDRQVASNRESVAQPQTPSLSPVQVKNGILRQRKGESAIADLRIETPASANCVLKLVNVRDGKEEMLIFVRRGSSYETKVPLGTYKIGLSPTKAKRSRPDASQACPRHRARATARICCLSPPDLRGGTLHC
jgi:hypothetical protein